MLKDICSELNLHKQGSIGHAHAITSHLETPSFIDPQANGKIEVSKTMLKSPCPGPTSIICVLRAQILAAAFAAAWARPNEWLVGRVTGSSQYTPILKTAIGPCFYEDGFGYCHNIGAADWMSLICLSGTHISRRETVP